LKELYSIQIGAIYRKILEQDKSFILICAYLFFEYVRPQTIYTWLEVIPWPPLIIFFTVVSLITEGKKRSRPKNILNSLMVLYLLVVLLSSVFSYDSARSFDKIRTFTDWFLIYYLIIYAVDDEPKFFIFLFSFLLYSFKMSQHGARVWALRGFGFTEWGLSGPSGWFQNSGELGIQMCIFLALSVFFVVSLRSYWGKYKRLFFYAFPFTAMMVVVASSSRGALLGALVALILPLIKNKKFIRGALLFSIVASTAYYFVPEESKARFQSAGDDHTSLHRLERWEQGMEAMLENPLLGVGHEAWSSYYPDHFIPEYPGTMLVHNIFVQCGSELGIIGLLVFLCMIFCSFRSCAEIRKMCPSADNPFLFYMSKGFDSALIGYLVSASFITVQYYPYFWIHLSMVVALHNVATKRYKSQGAGLATTKAKIS